MVGAETNNIIGIAGTAWGVRIMPVKVLDCAGVGLTSDVAQGILHAAQKGAQVIDLSLAGPQDLVPPISPGRELRPDIRYGHGASVRLSPVGKAARTPSRTALMFPQR